MTQTSKHRPDAGPAPDSIFALHAAFCQVFAEEKRLRIMWFLRGGERSVSEIADHLGATAQNVSQHLRIMQAKGAVERRRSGRSVYYRIASTKFVEGCEKIREGLLESLESRGLQARPLPTSGSAEEPNRLGTASAAPGLQE